MGRITAVVLACLLSSACVVYVQRTAETKDKPVEDAQEARTKTSPIEIKFPPVATAAPSAPVPDMPQEPAAEPAQIADVSGSPLPIEALCLAAHWPALDDLRPREAAQYVALRVRGESADTLATTELSSWGTRCAMAENPVECEIELVNVEDGLPYESTTCDPVCKQYYLVTSTASVIKAWGNLSALRALFGRVDTAGEAVLFAFYSVKGIDVSCAAAHPDQVQLVDGGYEFPIRQRLEDGCAAQVAVGTVRVAPSGSTTLELSDERVPADAPCP